MKELVNEQEAGLEDTGSKKGPINAAVAKPTSPTRGPLRDASSTSFPAPWSRQIQWPRCRWCHREIDPAPGEGFPFSWFHVTTGSAQCEGRPNTAEPVPQIHEEPFMLAAWEFVARYRRLRRAFRETSQSRASAVRRMHDYQELVDKLTAAVEAEEQLDEPVDALIKYRKSTISAGWR